MSCGVTITVSGVTVTCDNSGTSTHAGNHSGLLTATISVLGHSYSWSGQRVYWNSAAATVGRQKAAVLGESDFV